MSRVRTGRWLGNRNTTSSSQINSLYGISSVLIAVPEPSTASLLCAGVFVLLRRRTDTARRVPLLVYRR
ncbi:PEP-CTERM sorting domain-containing protein [Adhaeretor mobilis]